ncbi:MAG: biopolymer transporter ExbD [Pseudomonadota bacterium]
MFCFASPRSRRRVSLTPMIDVVFLLLIFFMLVSRFGVEHLVPVSLASSEAATYEGPPRLIDVTPSETLLNGVVLEPRPLLLELVRLTETGADTVVIRPSDGASVQRLVDVVTLLERAGFTSVAIVEARE